MGNYVLLNGVTATFVDYLDNVNGIEVLSD